MASQHGLPAGGPHVAPEQFRLMMACAEICRSCAHVMLIGVPEHKFVCRACAEICAACARSCEALADMQDCVAACRACAGSIRAIAG